MKKILTLSLLILLFFSCKKYEEGPLISLRSKYNRIVNKPDKRITEYKVNDVDQLGVINGLIGCDNYVLTFHDGRQTSTSELDNYVTFNAFGNSVCEDKVLDQNHAMGWLLTGHNNAGFPDKSEFVFSFFSPAFDYFNYVWEIKRLTINDLWLFTEDSSGAVISLKFKSED